MPGAHLTITAWQCFDDVGGFDVWRSNWWKVVPRENYSYQWWTGWHSPKSLTKWPWRGPWTLIGHERWDVLNGVSWKTQSQYADPNPSTTPRGHDLTPLGHWIVNYNQRGWETHRTWSQDILTAGALFLKGGGSKGEGKGQNKGKGYTKGKGKGSYTKGQGKDKGKIPTAFNECHTWAYVPEEALVHYDPSVVQPKDEQPKGKNKGKSEGKGRKGKNKGKNQGKGRQGKNKGKNL